jgi:hypothetical protein
MAITIHPDLQSLIPPLTAEEYQQLETNLLTEGCRDPLVIWREEQVLLDGHNRYAICTQHGLPYKTEEVSLPTLDAAQAWMIDNQLGRRNLTPEYAGYFRGKQFEYQKNGARGGGDRRSPTALNQNHQSEGNDTAAQLAAQHKVGKATIERDAAYARAVDTVAEVGGPEARQMLLAREAKVGRQDTQRLATLAKESPETAKEVLTAVRKASSTKEVRATLATAFGACEICGKRLSVPSSVEAGIGPVCACKPSGAATGAAAPGEANGVAPPLHLPARTALSWAWRRTWRRWWRPWSSCSPAWSGRPCPAPLIPVRNSVYGSPCAASRSCRP